MLPRQRHLSLHGPFQTLQMTHKKHQKAHVICIWKWCRVYPGLDTISVWDLLRPGPLWIMRNEIDWCFQYLESRVWSSGKMMKNHSKRRLTIMPTPDVHHHRKHHITLQSMVANIYLDLPSVQKLCLFTKKKPIQRQTFYIFGNTSWLSSASTLLKKQARRTSPKAPCSLRPAPRGTGSLRATRATTPGRLLKRKCESSEPTNHPFSGA